MGKMSKNGKNIPKLTENEKKDEKNSKMRYNKGEAIGLEERIEEVTCRKRVE